MANFKDQLDSAYFDLQAKIGVFLQTGQQVIRLRDRARQYSESSDSKVAGLASAVIAKANGLLENFKNIEKEGGNLASQALTLKGEIETLPIWKNILENSLDMVGWATSNAGKQKLAIGVSIMQNLVNVKEKMDAYMKEVTKLEGDVKALEDFAQGKGIKPIISGFAGLAEGQISKVVTIAAIGGLAWLLIPSLLGRSARASLK